MSERLSTIQSQLSSLRGQHDLLTQQEYSLTAEKSSAEDEITLLNSCLAVCEALTNSARERVASVIGPVCGAALRDVFEPGYDLEILSTQQPSGKYVSRLIATDGVVSGNPMAVRGGSVTGVLGIFLPAAVALLRPDLVQPWFSLDEPVGMLSGERAKRCAEAVYQLCHDPDRSLQIILTTQDPEPWEGLADVRVHVVKEGDRTVAKVTHRASEDDEL